MTTDPRYTVEAIAAMTDDELGRHTSERLEQQDRAKDDLARIARRSTLPLRDDAANVAMLERELRELDVIVNRLGDENARRLAETLAEELGKSLRKAAERRTDDRNLRELVADYVLLEQFDRLRVLAGHDYGAGQRAAELSRRRRELRSHGVDVELDVLELTEGDLDAAFERVGRPRMDRIAREEYRRATPATQSTIATWHRLERSARTWVDYYNAAPRQEGR